MPQNFRTHKVLLFPCNTFCLSKNHFDILFHKLVQMWSSDKHVDLILFNFDNDNLKNRCVFYKWFFSTKFWNRFVMLFLWYSKDIPYSSSYPSSSKPERKYGFWKWCSYYTRFIANSSLFLFYEYTFTWKMIIWCLNKRPCFVQKISSLAILSINYAFSYF